MNTARFVICSFNETDDDKTPLFWSNRDGWVDLDSATQFTSAEANRFKPPMGGHWTVMEPGLAGLYQRIANLTAALSWALDVLDDYPLPVDADAYHRYETGLLFARSAFESSGHIGKRLAERKNAHSSRPLRRLP